MEDGIAPVCAGVVVVCEGVVVVCVGEEDVSCVVEPVPPVLQPANTNPINIRATASNAGMYLSFSDISLSLTINLST
jgi:hypothetical protein